MRLRLDLFLRLRPKRHTDSNQRDVEVEVGKFHHSPKSHYKVVLPFSGLKK